MTLTIDDLHLVLQRSLHHLSTVARHGSMDAYSVLAHGRPLNGRI